MRVKPLPHQDRPATTVCMATYNGSSFVVEQIASILPQLAANDELVIIDDASRDDTVAVVSALEDPRIRLIASPHNRGYVRTFESAIAEARGEVIFLSDQDDLWLPGRVDAMRAALEDADLVVSNFSSFGGPLTRVQARRLRAKDSGRRLANVWWVWVGLRPYYGCCMAFRSSLKEQLLPFPRYLTETHDQWIGFVANLGGRVRHLEADTISRRVHDANSSARGDRAVATVLTARWMTGRAIIQAFLRARRRRRALTSHPSLPTRRG